MNPVDRLASLLKAASEAHHTHAESSAAQGITLAADEWILWYAQYLAQHDVVILPQDVRSELENGGCLSAAGWEG